MIICYKEEIYVLEALMNTGVALNSLRRLKNVIEEGGVIGIRHLSFERKKSPAFLKLRDHLSNVVGRPYEQQLGAYVRAGLGRAKAKKDQNNASWFCSQLVAGLLFPPFFFSFFFFFSLCHLFPFPLFFYFYFFFFPPTFLTSSTPAQVRSLQWISYQERAN